MVDSSQQGICVEDSGVEVVGSEDSSVAIVGSSLEALVNCDIPVVWRVI